MMRIGEFAASVGLSPKTVRFYEEIGLLSRPTRTPSGYRLYSAADGETAAFIAKAKVAGFTLHEIGQVLARRRAGEEPCDHVRDLIASKLAAIELRLDALARLREQLAAMRDRPDTQAGACGGWVCAIIEGTPPES